MTTSGADGWNPQLQFLIQQAQLNATAIEEGETLGGEAYVTSLLQINAMVKGWEASGLHVWTEEEGVLFPQVGVARYVIGGPAPTAHTADANSWTQLSVAAPAAAAALTLTVADASGLADGQHVGVVLVDGTTQWTTIAGLAGAVVTLADLLAQAVDAGAVAMAYETALTRPLKIPRARLLTLASQTEIPMMVLSRQEYMDLPQKNQPGVPTQFFYAPRRDQGELYLWTTPNYTSWAVRFTWYRALQDFLTPTNTADMPQEWLNALIWNHALEIATSYGVPEATYNRLKERADFWLTAAASYDRESEPVQFGMDYAFGYRR